VVDTSLGGVVLYRNNGDGTFTDVTKSAGLTIDKGWATGAVFGDYDGDGNTDLFVPHYVDFDVNGILKNHLALNARIRLTTGTQQQLQEVRSGGSYLSRSDLHLHFGIGKASIIDKVEATWPNGPTQSFTNLQPNHFYSLKQNGTLVLSDPTH
jgi:hypothetical protein